MVAGLEIQREELAGRLTLRLTGTLDGQTAMMLRSSLEELGSREVVVDFTHLREFRDSAVGVLTHGLMERKVQLRGLAGHHERMFRYFGLTTGNIAPQRAYYTPEEVLA
ncbi:STAS domain-containing protein [Archangium sp.]|uniref:STAS domain-containing protein n=1 Tax=Archangium sp. TaxID=1872627 RepID=UPI002D69A5A2|nr:STAS domain-containing protein [Archangium sp.]HYO51914.1 STAS domain-containing protein [Archangium sp.]